MMGNMDDLMGSMTDMFSIEEDENGDKRITIKGGNNLNFLFNNDESNSSKSNKTQKFKFYDDPNSEKIIIIDGKESSFEAFFYAQTFPKKDEIVKNSPKKDEKPLGFNNHLKKRPRIIID